MKTPPYFLIESFLAFADAKNMLQAAEKLKLSQPALTNHLRMFESYFPQDIFALEGRKKTLTPFGNKVRELLEEKFSHLSSDLSVLNQKFQRPEDVLVRISGRSEIINPISDKLKFAGTLAFIASDGQQAVHDLLSRRCDIAISNHLAKAHQLHGKKLFSDHFSIAIPEAWKIKSERFSEGLINQLIHKPYLSYKDVDNNLQKVLQHFAMPQSPQITRVIADWPSLLKMVEQNQGWTICPERFASEAHCAALPVPSQLIPITDFYYLYRKEFVDLPWGKDILSQLGKISRL